MAQEREERNRSAHGRTDPRLGSEAPSSGDWFFEDLRALIEERSDTSPSTGNADAAEPRSEAPPRPPRALTGRRRRPVPAARVRGGPLERLLIVALAAAFVLAVALGGAVAVKAGVDRRQASEDVRRFSTSTGTASPVVAVIADRAVLGPANVRSNLRWPALLRDSLGGDVVPLGSPGMGYLKATSSGGTFIDEVRRIPETADVILFVSGNTDAGSRTLPMLKATTAAYSAAAVRAPRARIVVIGPVLSAAMSARQLATLRQTLRLAATTAGVDWVDPLQDRWLGARAESVASAGALKEIDQRMIAERVTALVRRLES